MQRLTLALLLALTSLWPAAADPHLSTPPAATLSLSAPTAAPAADVDLCPVCHHPCGCHQAAVLDRGVELPPRLAQIATFRRESWQTCSISSECPRKPPRA